MSTADEKVENLMKEIKRLRGILDNLMEENRRLRGIRISEEDKEHAARVVSDLKREIDEHTLSEFVRGEITIRQDGNTLGTTGDSELLTIEAETQLPGEEPFFVLRTEGWSFDSVEELAAELERKLRQFEDDRS